MVEVSWSNVSTQSQIHKSVEESLEIIRTLFSGDHMWALELKETGEPIGCMGYFTQGRAISA